MRPNKIKQLWRDGQCVTLGWLSVSHGITARSWRGKASMRCASTYSTAPLK